MFMSDCTHQGGIRVHAINYLSNLGLPCENIYKQKKIQSNRWKVARITFLAENEEEPVKIFSTNVFSAPLKSLESGGVTLSTGQTLPIPKIIQELCEAILENVETEGIFERRGSRSKQQRIIARIDEQRPVPYKYLNAVDMAAILRLYLRTLPEPLIPYAYHNLFLACGNLSNKKEVLMIATLLLPSEHLNLLTYLMQFFKEVTTYSEFNKMNSYRLAVCIAKDILPVCKFSYGIFDRTTEVTRLLIKESSDIGFITKDMSKKLRLDGYFEYERTSVLSSIFDNFKKFFCIVI